MSWVDLTIFHLDIELV